MHLINSHRLIGTLHFNPNFVDKRNVSFYDDKWTSHVFDL